MSRGGKFLRPPSQGGGPLFGSESEESGSEEEEEEDNQKKGNSANLSSDDDDDDEDEASEEEEEEEEDDEPSRKRGRDKKSVGSSARKKSKSASFFDEEAEASDDDEEDDEPYGTHHDPHDVVKKHYTEEDIRREQMDEEAEEIIRAQNRRRAQAGGYGFTGMTEEDIARDIEERHRMQRRVVDRTIHDGDDASVAVDGPSYSAVSQQSLVPSVSDPRLWMIGCSTGKEQELVVQIMNKCIAYAHQGKPLGITGCVAAQSKGRIYIESYSEPAVMEAIQGVRNLLQYNMRMVPISDMTTVMTVVNKKKPVKKNEWVRMTKGHYKGDLAIVKLVRESGLKCVIQCVPRIDLTLSDLPPEEARIRRRTVRPAQKFFNSQEIAALGKTSSRGRFPGLDTVCDVFENNYYHEGYLLREVAVSTMIKPCSEESPPTLDELQRFRRRPKASGESGYDDNDDEENEGSKVAASLLDELSDLQGKTGLGTKKTNGGLIIGDTVEVVEGDLVGLRGKLLSVDGTTVKVQPLDATDLGGMNEVEFLTNQVRKYIAVGAHVKVTDGRYANETGIVVAVEELEGDTDCIAVVMTDMTHKEVSVRTSQLQESAEVASGQDKLAGYELHDLVVLSGGGSANEVGVIVRVGREEFTVINNHGIVREVRPEELRGKRNASSQRAVALDVQGNQIRCGDLVSIAEGPHKGKTATIKRMSRAQLFLYSQTRTEHAGIFVVRSRSCVLSGSRSRPAAAADSRQQQGGPGGGPRGRRGDDGLIGKTVKISSGKWKGYLGGVSDATATHVQVELHSRMKKVMVVRERVIVVGDKFGATEDPSRSNQDSASMLAPSTPFMSGGATPMHGGATPMHGGATPMHDGFGGSTPSHSSSADDVWRPGGSIDRAPLGEESMDSNTADNTGGWGSTSVSNTSEQQSDPFGGSPSTNTDDGGGWGTSNESDSNTWTPNTSEADDQSRFTDDMSSAVSPNGAVAIKQDPYATTEATTMVKTEGNEIKKDIGDMGPGMGDDNGEAAVWFMERVCVTLKRNDSPAVIKEINSDKTAVVELDEGTVIIVRPGEVSMVQPQEHDMVLVTGGADVGVEGELVCIDGTDAILKEQNENFKIVDFVHLAKIKPM